MSGSDPGFGSGLGSLIVSAGVDVWGKAGWRRWGSRREQSGNGSRLGMRSNHASAGVGGTSDQPGKAGGGVSGASSEDGCIP